MADIHNTDQWQQAFESQLKTKSYEKFNLLICDLSKADDKQKGLLSKILFKDCKSVQFWGEYINYVFSKKSGSGKLQLQRLVNKALELLDEAMLKDNVTYLSIHLKAAFTESSTDKSLKYFQNVIRERNIGMKFAATFVAWSEQADAATGDYIAASEPLRLGLTLHAEPARLINSKMADLKTKYNIKDSSQEEEDDDSDEPTKPIDATAIKKAVVSAATSSSATMSSIRAARSSRVSGKCQRVVTAEAETGIGKEEKELVVPISAARLEIQARSKQLQEQQQPPGERHVTGTLDIPIAVQGTDRSSNSISQKKKNLLAQKYLDDNVKNFQLGPRRPVKAIMDTSAVTATKRSIGSTSCMSSSSGRDDGSGDEATVTLAPDISVCDVTVKIPDSELLSFVTSSSSTSKRPADAMTRANCGRRKSLRSSVAKVEEVENNTTNGRTSSDDDDDEATIECDTVRISPNKVSSAAAQLSNQSKHHKFAIDAYEPKIKSTADELGIETSTSSNSQAYKKKRVSFVKPPSPIRPAIDPSSSSSSTMPPPLTVLGGAPAVVSLDSTNANITGSDLSLGIFSDVSRLIKINGRSYTRLTVLGKGGSSCVYRVVSHENGQTCAYKRVDIKDSSSSEDAQSTLDSYSNEIALLSSLRGTSPRIIDLLDHEVCRESGNMYVSMLLEAGDIDLAKVLSQRIAVGNSAGVAKVLPVIQELDPFFSRMIWKEMLEAVDHIHLHRIVHGDLKPANFVFSRGHIKLIDFGIAKSFSADTTNIYRESQIGTVNYMAPEAIAPMSEDEQIIAQSKSKGSRKRGTSSNNRGEMKGRNVEAPQQTLPSFIDASAGSDGATSSGSGSMEATERYKMRLGRASDVWSLGCILYQMVYGRPPFAALSTIQKLTSIPNPRYAIHYPDLESVDADAIDSIKACLIRDPTQRAKISAPRGDVDVHVEIGVGSYLLDMAYLRMPSHRDRVNSSTELDESTVAITAPLQPIEDAAADCVSTCITTLDDAQVEALIMAVKKSESSNSRGNKSNRVNALRSTIQGILSKTIHCGGAGSDTPSSISCSHNDLYSPTTTNKLSRSEVVESSKPVPIYEDRQSTEHNKKNSPTTGLSSCPARTIAAAPLRSLSTNIQAQLRSADLKAGLQSVQSSSRGERWMKKPQSDGGGGGKAAGGKNDLRSALERRMEEMRKFMDVEQDENTVNDSVDMTDFSMFM